MTDLETLINFHDICQMKYRYGRALDTQDFPLLESCFTEDAVLWPTGGQYIAQGRSNIISLVKSILIPSFYTSHLILQPEIDFDGPNRAKGTWRLQDELIFTTPHPFIKHMPISGGERASTAAFYYDEYEKVDGSWKISSCGYISIFARLQTPGDAGAAVFTNPQRGVNTEGLPKTGNS